MRYRIKEKVYDENHKKYIVQKFSMFIPIWRTMKYEFENGKLLISPKSAIFNTKEKAEDFLLSETDDHVYLDSNINIYKTY